MELIPVIWAIILWTVFIILPIKIIAWFIKVNNIVKHYYMTDTQIATNGNPHINAPETPKWEIEDYKIDNEDLVVFIAIMNPDGSYKHEQRAFDIDTKEIKQVLTTLIEQTL